MHYSRHSFCFSKQRVTSCRLWFDQNMFVHIAPWLGFQMLTKRLKIISVAKMTSEDKMWTQDLNKTHWSSGNISWKNISKFLSKREKNWSVFFIALPEIKEKNFLNWFIKFQYKIGSWHLCFSPLTVHFLCTQMAQLHTWAKPPFLHHMLHDWVALIRSFSRFWHLELRLVQYQEM